MRTMRTDVKSMANEEELQRINELLSKIDITLEEDLELMDYEEMLTYRLMAEIDMEF